MTGLTWALTLRWGGRPGLHKGRALVSWGACLVATGTRGLTLPPLLLPSPPTHHHHHDTHRQLAPLQRGDRLSGPPTPPDQQWRRPAGRRREFPLLTTPPSSCANPPTAFFPRGLASLFARARAPAPPCSPPPPREASSPFPGGQLACMAAAWAAHIQAGGRGGWGEAGRDPLPPTAL